jgi:hypothetical protein
MKKLARAMLLASIVLRIDSIGEQIGKQASDTWNMTYDVHVTTVYL